MNNQSINEVLNRDLDSCFFSIYFLSGKLFYDMGNDYIKERTFYNIFYCNIKGERRYINTIFEDEFTKGSDWYNLFSLWKKKGCEVILHAIIPENKKLKEALSLAFPEVKTFLSCYETLRKIRTYFSTNFSCKVLMQIKNIYLAKDINDFNFQKEEFLNDASDYPFISDLTECDFKYAKKYIEIPLELRRHIFSFYFMREQIKSINKYANSKPSFSTIKEFQELLIPIIQSIELRMYCPKKEWNTVLSIVYKEQKELIYKYL